MKQADLKETNRISKSKYVIEFKNSSNELNRLDKVYKSK
jgi:hypothetical protein